MSSPLPRKPLGRRFASVSPPKTSPIRNGKTTKGAAAESGKSTTKKKTATVAFDIDAPQLDHPPAPTPRRRDGMSSVARSVTAPPMRPGRAIKAVDFNAPLPLIVGMNAKDMDASFPQFDVFEPQCVDPAMMAALQRASLARDAQAAGKPARIELPESAAWDRKATRQKPNSRDEECLKLSDEQRTARKTLLESTANVSLSTKPRVMLQRDVWRSGEASYVADEDDVTWCRGKEVSVKNLELAFTLLEQAYAQHVLSRAQDAVAPFGGTQVTSAAASPVAKGSSSPSSKRTATAASSSLSVSALEKHQKQFHDKGQNSQGEAVCRVCAGLLRPSVEPQVGCSKCKLVAHESCFMISSGYQNCWVGGDAEGRVDSAAARAQAKVTCDVCASGQNPRDVECLVCKKSGGFMIRASPSDDKAGSSSSASPRSKKKLSSASFVHIACTSMIKEAVIDVEKRCCDATAIDARRKSFTCCLCKKKGSGGEHLVQCRHSRCMAAMHVQCALAAGLVERKGGVGTPAAALCPQHHRDFGIFSVPTQNFPFGEEDTDVSRAAERNAADAIDPKVFDAAAFPLGKLDVTEKKHITGWWRTRRQQLLLKSAEICAEINKGEAPRVFRILHPSIIRLRSNDTALLPSADDAGDEASAGAGRLIVRLSRFTSLIPALQLHLSSVLDGNTAPLDDDVATPADTAVSPNNTRQLLGRLERTQAHMVNVAGLVQRVIARDAKKRDAVALEVQELMGMAGLAEVGSKRPRAGTHTQAGLAKSRGRK